MRFTRYPGREPYEVTPRKLAAARRAVQKETDRYPLFPELLKHKSAEERLSAIAIDREHWWQQMRDHRAKQWRRARPGFTGSAARAVRRDQTLLAN